MGSPIMTNLYYGTVKQILERVSSVMIDRDVYTVEQFYNLSQLVVDDVKQVREQFVAKLHKVCLEYSKYFS